MKYYLGIETLNLGMDHLGRPLVEQSVLKNLDGTYSTDNNIENCFLKVHIIKYIIDGNETYICIPSGNKDAAERFEIDFDDIVQFKAGGVDMDFVAAEKILSYSALVGIKGGTNKKIKEYFKDNNI